MTTVFYNCVIFKIFMLMKKFLIFMVLVMTSLCITSCSWFDNPAEAKRVGCGHIKNDGGLLIVEIDGVKYAPTSIYTGKSTRDGKTTIDPIEGMEVTVFYADGEYKPKFIAGNRSEEYLEDYFSGNSTLAVVFLIVIILCFICCFIPEGKRKTVVAD